MVGTEIGNYRILEKLGEGGMGVVYKAVDVNLDRIVAVKALNTEFSGNPELEQRFRAEIKAPGNLNHPNLATLYTLFIENGRPWMVMEFIEGETLDQMVQRRGPIPSEEAIPLFRQALFGIGYAHRMGIVHRDIKPGNIMLNRQGIVKVMDFGIAKALSGPRRGDERNSDGHRVLHVARAISESRRGLPVRHLFSGRDAVRNADSQRAVQRRQRLPDHGGSREHAAAAADALFPLCSAGVQNAVLKAIEKNPDARYQTVEEFGWAL